MLDSRTINCPSPRPCNSWKYAQVTQELHGYKDGLGMARRTTGEKERQRDETSWKVF